MKLKIKILGIVIFVVCLILVVYSAAYGRLLPYSPFIVGFEKKTYKMATVYYHKEYNLPSLEEIGNFIEKNENIHGLKYKRNVDVILCESDREKKRITGSLSRAQSFFIFGRVVVSRRLQDEAVAHEKPFGMYLQHELSHSLTYLSTDIGLSNEDIVRIYGKRWDIEVFFKMAKQHLKLAKEIQCRDYPPVSA